MTNSILLEIALNAEVPFSNENTWNAKHKNTQILTHFCSNCIFVCFISFNSFGSFGSFESFNENDRNNEPTRLDDFAGFDSFPSFPFDSFNEGMASFRVNWKYGFINRNFEEVIPPIYDFAYGFKDGLARVEKDGKWFYIDKQGNFVKEYKPSY